MEKDSDDFWLRKLTLKVKFLYFLTAPHYSNFQNLVISFEYSWFLAKNLSNFVSLPWKLHNRKCHSGHTIFERHLLLMMVPCAIKRSTLGFYTNQNPTFLFIVLSWVRTCVAKIFLCAIYIDSANGDFDIIKSY